MEGARRLGGNSIGLAHWQTNPSSAPPVLPLRIAATPARHRRRGLNRGAVNGLVLTVVEENE